MNSEQSFWLPASEEFFCGISKFQIHLLNLCYIAYNEWWMWAIFFVMFSKCVYIKSIYFVRNKIKNIRQKQALELLNELNENKIQQWMNEKKKQNCFHIYLTQETIEWERKKLSPFGCLNPFSHELAELYKANMELLNWTERNSTEINNETISLVWYCSITRSVNVERGTRKNEDEFMVTEFISFTTIFIASFHNW